MVTEALTGVWVGYVANSYKEDADSALAGVHRWLTFSLQEGLINDALYLAPIAFSAVPLVAPLLGPGWYLVPIVTNLFCYALSIKKKGSDLSPSEEVFWKARSWLDDHPFVVKAIVGLNEAIGSICLVVIAVSSVALLFFGQPVLGGVTLAFVCAGFAERHHWLPLAIRKGVHRVGWLGTNFERIVVGDLMEKLAGVIEVGHEMSVRIDQVKKRFFPPAPIAQEEDRAAEALSFVEGDKIVEEAVSLAPEAWTAKAEIPKADDVIDLEDLKKMFTKFDLKAGKYREILIEMVKKDQHWRNLVDTKAKEETDEACVVYVQDGVNRIVDQLVNQTMTDGDFEDYSQIVNRAKLITNELKKLEAQGSNEQRIFRRLAELGLGSYYCADGKMRVVCEVYMEVCDRVDELSLSSRLYRCLAAKRLDLFTQILMLIDSGEVTEIQYKALHEWLLGSSPSAPPPDWFQKEKKFIGKINHLFSDPEETHNFNDFVGVFGDEFGLAEIEESQLGQNGRAIDLLDRFIFKLCYRPVLELFKQKYNVQEIIKVVKDAIQDRTTRELLEAWFTDEYIKTTHEDPLDNETPAKYRVRMLQQAMAFVYDEETCLKKEYLLYFLIKMKILKFHPAVASTLYNF